MNKKNTQALIITFLMMFLAVQSGKPDGSAPAPGNYPVQFARFKLETEPHETLITWELADQYALVALNVLRKNEGESRYTPLNAFPLPVIVEEMGGTYAYRDSTRPPHTAARYKIGMIFADGSEQLSQPNRKTTQPPSIPFASRSKTSSPSPGSSTRPKSRTTGSGRASTPIPAVPTCSSPSPTLISPTPTQPSRPISVAAPVPA